jgi:pimeloyl-ACP methyl ester carboxylesterase
MLQIKKAKKMSYIDLGHGKTKYMLEGEVDNKDAQLVVLVHGIDVTLDNWIYLAQHLVQVGGFKVLRMDLYGRGYSDTPKVPVTGDVFVEQIHQLLAKLDLLEPFSLIGHSMGGAVCSCFTQKYPELVKKLILLTPAGLPWKLPFGSGMLGLPVLGNLVFNMSMAIDGVEKVTSAEFFDLKKSEEAIKYLMDVRAKWDVHGKLTKSFTETFRHFSLTGCGDKIEEIGKQDRPTLVIWGELDVTILPKECLPQWMKKFEPNKQLSIAVFKDTRHSFFMERVEESNKFIECYLRGDDIKKFHSDTAPSLQKLTTSEQKVRTFINSLAEQGKVLVV